MNINIQQTQTNNTCEIIDFPEISGSSSPYRYFNQPIEQIPGWNKDEPQILFHGKNHGLVWVNIQCVPVVTCATIGPAQGSGSGSGSGSCNCELTLTRNKLYVLKDAGTITGDCAEEITNQSYRYDAQSNSWVLFNSKILYQ